MLKSTGVLYHACALLLLFLNLLRKEYFSVFLMSKQLDLYYCSAYHPSSQVTPTVSFYILTKDFNRARSIQNLILPQGAL
jgi:hypothetical protein